MESSENKETTGSGKAGFKRFAAKRIIVGVLLIVAILWLLSFIFGYFTESKHTDVKTAKTEHAVAKPDADTHAEKGGAAHTDSESKMTVETNLHKEKAVAAATHKMDTSYAKTDEKFYTKFAENEPEEEKVIGVAFVEALVKTMDYELNGRFYGWRPNDIFDFTDNVNSFQLGVLEITRRTVDKLAENISRTGSTAAFDKNLENARNTCFVVEAERYWFPSPEGKYNDGLEDLMEYAKKLKKGEASFFTRADTLIPLLQEYEHVLGSCDDNLVKSKEGDGSPVSFFQADEYFYYAKGVSSAIAEMLEAIEEDFHKTLERRNCLAELHHAIESCQHANHIEPLIVTNSDLSGIIANHRANLAAHVSHTRFYIGVLIKTLST
jgi:hypothetical protein